MPIKDWNSRGELRSMGAPTPLLAGTVAGHSWGSLSGLLSYLLLSHSGIHSRRSPYARHQQPILTRRMSNYLRLVCAMIVRLPLAAYAFFFLALFLANPAHSSTGTAIVGQSITFAVSADGTTPFSYQWFKNGAMIAGATGATYSISGVQATDAGDYYASVSNSAGSATSDTATILVETPVAPTITTQPAGQTVVAGASATFTVASSGTPAPTFQWQVSTDGGSTWMNLADAGPYSGSVSGTLAVTGVTAALNGYQYRCATTNGVSPDATSFAATLTVMSLSDQAFLQQLFLDVLGRPIDSGGAASFGAALAGGESRAAVLGVLLGSTEYSLREIEPVIRLYSAALVRCPDMAGLQNWTGALQTGALTLTGAGDQFASSAEFLLDYGNLDNTGYVEQLYLNVLGRQADPVGLAKWLGQLNAGISRGAVLIGFSESDEFKAAIANQVEIVRLHYLLLHRMPTATELQNWLGFLRGYDQTDALFGLGYPAGLAPSDYIQLVFQGFLRRAADSGALSAFGSALTAGAASHGSVVNSLLTSAEFNTLVGPVSRLYMAALLRVPDQPGLDNWVAFLRAGNSLQSAADAFVASQEFTNRYGALSNRDYVAALYVNVLGRQADATGLANWVAQLNGGASRGQVLLGFSESPEGIGLFAPTVGTFLQYFAFLNATPAQSDLDYWTNYLTTLDVQMRDDLLANPAFASGN
jgi:hypothetical protein